MPNHRPKFPPVQPQQSLTESRHVYAESSKLLTLPAYIDPSVTYNHPPLLPPARSYGLDYRQTSPRSPSPDTNSTTTTTNHNDTHEETPESNLQGQQLQYDQQQLHFHQLQYSLCSVPVPQGSVEDDFDIADSLENFQVNEEKITIADSFDSYEDTISGPTITELVGVLRSSRCRDTNIYRTPRLRKNPGHKKRRDSERLSMAGMDILEDEPENSKEAALKSSKSKIRRRKRREETKAQKEAGSSGAMARLSDGMNTERYCNTGSVPFFPQGEYETHPPLPPPPLPPPSLPPPTGQYYHVAPISGDPSVAWQPSDDHTPLPLIYNPFPTEQ